MDDVEHWLGAHAGELHELAEKNDTDDHTVRLVASLVLHGWSDDAIYEQLRALVLSNDGEQNPLADVPVVLAELRRLTATS